MGGGRGWGYVAALAVLRPGLSALARRDWRGLENIPATGGAVVAANHVSHLDAVTVGHFVAATGRTMRYLIKSSLWRNPLLRAVFDSAGQIPVHRGGPDAALAYEAAVAAVRAGEVAVVFPEGTLTRDPGLWPMRGRTGAARIALASGAPVIPVGQWGPHEILPPYVRRLRVWPRRTVKVWAGPPVPLDDLRGRPVDADVLDEATERIMAAITAIVADQRGEAAPLERFDPRRRAA